ncbi:MAG: DNA polymerase I, partial [Anaerotignum sp.]|nr:DNA polymerase I [Anaerotignum sp.]
LAKLKSTYADGLLAVMDMDTEKIYSTFNQTITATGRISSTEPNLQNIPVRLELGRELRKVFIPENEDYCFLDADYSQIELRVLAHIAGDESLIEAFQSGQDIHRMTASQVFHVPFEEVTSLQRSNAKAVNFGIIYGKGSFTLGQDLGITRKEAEEYINAYFARYPKIKGFMDETIKNGAKDGYVSTLWNRRRAMPELQSSNFIQRAAGERAAMNMPIQGSAADIIKLAMIKVHQALKDGGYKSRLILQVHDELLIETHKDEKEAVAKILKENMEQAAELLVPLDVDVHEGASWYEAK